MGFTSVMCRREVDAGEGDTGWSCMGNLQEGLLQPESIGDLPESSDLSQARTETRLQGVEGVGGKETRQ